MKQQQVKLWDAQEYQYPAHGGFIPSIMTYLHEEDERIRPAILIAPGGAYCVASPTEGEIVALRFYEAGYNTFVVTYTTNYLMDQPVGFQAMRDLSRAVVWVRCHADALHVDAGRVAICGFSAGGHLCGSLCVHYDADELKESGVYAGISNRPDAVILSYPVINSREYTHGDSMRALLGPDPSEEALDYMSLEKQVKPDSPPAFLWTTFTDELVPCENSFLYAAACRKNGVPVELHVFADGIHGLSLANETWAKDGMKADYTMEQTFGLIQYLFDNDLPLPEDYAVLNGMPKGTKVKEVFERIQAQASPAPLPDPSISVWPELADAWLKAVYK